MMSGALYYLSTRIYTRLMASCRGRLKWWLHLIIAVAGVSTWWRPVNSAGELKVGCSSNLPKSNTRFQENRKTAFSNLRSRVSEGLMFNTTNVETNPELDRVYTMVQCRRYMSVADCLTCYDNAVGEILKVCSGTGGRATSDGCFLRYEDYDFFQKSNENELNCGDISVETNVQDAFREQKDKFLNDLQLAIPNMVHYYAASKMNIKNAGSLTVYGVAQCVDTITKDACRNCIFSAYLSIKDCSAATDARLNNAGCFMRYSNVPFFHDSNITDIKPFLPGSGKIRAIIGGVAGSAGFAIIIVAVTLWFVFSRKLKIATRGNILGATELQRTNRYSYRELEAATNNFSEENRVGKGGFGSVYKAIWSNGFVLAVKQLNMSHSSAKADFETEVRLISNVHHRNLLRLLGCCSKGPKLLLVYEYMENGSLDRFLYGGKRGSLTWKQRLDIIFGIAKGIAYLHEHYHVTIIHRDIKPGNILLDSQLQPKIADFGLVRLLPEDQTHMSTKFAGTLGYTAPEYARSGHLSEKVDVYSFGIVVLEIISGRRCSDVNENSDAPYLLEEARRLCESGEHHKLADEALESDECEAEDLKKMVEIALICTQPVSSRPTMSEVIVMISGDRSVVAQRMLQPIGYASKYSSISNGSNATLSVSHYTGR